MAFTAGEITNIANAALDFYYNKGDTFKQSIQSKPLLRLMEGSAKSFPGGKGNISMAVKGAYGAGGVNDKVVGYTHNDTVSFYTPANIQRVNYPWREHHIGITLTHTELKIDGISVTDEHGDGTSMSNHSDRDVTVLVNLLQDKYEDFGEQYARTMNALMWGDGTADAKALAGLLSIIVAIPNTGSTGGLSRSANTWWRNRAGGIWRRRRKGSHHVEPDQRRRAPGLSAERVSPADPLRRPADQMPCRVGLHRRDGDRDQGQRQLLDERLSGVAGRLDGPDAVHEHDDRV